MTRNSVLRLVLLVSCAHALVHMYEHSVPSVEQEIAAEYHGGDVASGKQLTGWLAWAWRFPWGIGALFAGWLVDCLGSRRMLAVYLLGCGACAGLMLWTTSLGPLFASMLLMGAFASIYHPAGLALISHETQPHTLPKALGLHGVFGTAGIASAPFIAAFLLARNVSWREFYLWLAVPGLVLGCVFLSQIGRDRAPASDQQARTREGEADRSDWVSFFLLTGLALLQGIIYSAVLSFLPRYLTALESLWNVPGVSMSRLVTSFVLLVGCVGQYAAGRIARPERLELQLTWISLANAPCLFWMAFALGPMRPAAATLFALVHFMHQPIYNSLIAKYTPRRRRSLCYGFSFAMGLGLGSTGALLAGYAAQERTAHLMLTGIACLAAMIGGALTMRNRPQSGRTKADGRT